MYYSLEVTCATLLTNTKCHQ